MASRPDPDIYIDPVSGDVLPGAPQWYPMPEDLPTDVTTRTREAPPLPPPRGGGGMGIGLFALLVPLAIMAGKEVNRGRKKKR
jgi:hypothetical protein